MFALIELFCQYINSIHHLPYSNSQDYHSLQVAGIVGRAELLAALFFIAALLTYHKAVLARGMSIP